MAETMSVEAVLSAVDKNFSSTMQSAIREMGEMINKTNQVSNVPNPGAGWTKMGALAGVAGSLASSAATMITNGLHDVVAGLNESSAAWQTFEGNMAYMGKSSGQIKAVKAELQDFAQKSIYSASDMATTYSQLAAVGVKNTTKLVKGFGGLAGAAENPKQAMKTLSMQATQMAAKPMVQWQDFKLMLEQTPAGIAAVAKSMGMSSQQLVKQVQDGKVKTQDFFNAIEKAGNSKAFQKQATTYKTMGQAMDGLVETITNKLQPAFDAIGKVGAGAIGKIIDGISSGSPVVAILGSLTAGIGAFVTTLGTLYAGAKLAQGAMALFNGVLSASPWMLVIAGVVAVVSALTTFFTSTETGKKMWKSFSDFVVNSWNSIKSVVSPTISFLMDLFGQIGTAVQGMIQTMAPVMQTMGAVFAPLMTALQQLWSLIQPFVTFILQVVGAVLLAIVVAAITGIIGSISLLTSIITALIGVFTAVVSTVSSVWQSIMAIISGAVAIIVTVVTTFGQAIVALFTGHWNRIPGIFSSGWAKVKSIFSSTISTLKSIVSNWGSSLVSAGKAIMDGFLSGLKSGFEAVKNFISEIKDWIIAHKGPVKDDAKALIPAGNAFMEGLNSGLMEGFSAVQSNVASMASQIRDAINDSVATVGNFGNLSTTVNTASAGTMTSRTIASVTDDRNRSMINTALDRIVNRLDNLEQHPVVTVDGLNTINSYNNKRNAMNYSMERGY